MEKKWFEGMGTKDIISTIKGVSLTVVEMAEKEKHEESERLEDTFLDMFKEVIPAIVDMKTEFWAFRNDNNVYNDWDECQRELWSIRHNLQEKLEKIYN